MDTQESYAKLSDHPNSSLRSLEKRKKTAKTEFKGNPLKHSSKNKPARVSDPEKFRPAENGFYAKEIRDPVFFDRDGNPGTLNYANVGVNFFTDSNRIAVLCGVMVGLGLILYMYKRSQPAWPKAHQKAARQLRVLAQFLMNVGKFER